MKYIIITSLLIAGCSSTSPKTEMTKYERYQCLKNKKLAEESGSGIKITCD